MSMKSLILSLLATCLFVSSSFAAVKPGDKAPQFALKSTQGKSVKRSDFPGKVVVLEWSNFDCPFVKKHYHSNNIPSMQKKYKEQGVVWLTVISSAPGKQGHYSAEKLRDKTESMGNQANAVLMDESGEVGIMFGVKTTPQFVIIGADDRVVYTGAIDSIASTDEKDIEKARNHVKNALDAVKQGKAVKVSLTAPYGCSVKY